MHEVLVNHLGGLSLPRKSVVRFSDRPDMTLDIYRGRKTTIQHTLKIDGKHDLLTNFSSRGQEQPQLGLSCRAHEGSVNVLKPF